MSFRNRINEPHFTKFCINLKNLWLCFFQIIACIRVTGGSTIVEMYLTISAEHVNLEQDLMVSVKHLTGLVFSILLWGLVLNTINSNVSIKLFIVQWYLTVSVKHLTGLVFSTLLSGLVLNTINSNVSVKLFIVEWYLTVSVKHLWG
jgi:hypothetical protein